MKLIIKYFAALREQAGVGEEVIETDAPSPQAVYEELKDKYGFSLSADILKVSVNNKYSTMDHELKERDSLVFIPPVAGG